MNCLTDRKSALRAAVAILILAGLAPLKAQVPVTLDLVDQNQVPIPGSTIRILGTTYPRGATVVLPLGSHAFDLVPGVLGTPSAPRLSRTEVHAVTATTSSIAFEWRTALVTLRIRDQFGANLSQTEILNDSGGLIGATGALVTLPVTDPTLYPTMSGTAADGYDVILDVSPGPSVQRLLRSNTHALVLDDQTELAFEWRTALVTLRIRDQFGTNLPQSEILNDSGVLIGATGTQVTLPVTDPALYPTMYGNAADGYDVILDVSPGPSVQRLLRSNTHALVLDGQTELAFEWRTALVTLRIRDQFGANLPQSEILNDSGVLIGATGTQVTLPVTDPALYPTMYGSAANGYDVILDATPGSATLLLLRTESQALVLDGASELSFEWSRFDCPLVVVDVDHVPLVASTIALPSAFVPFQPGNVVSFPSTDNAVYSTIYGTFANGYPITIAPSDLGGASATFQFEVLANGELAPPSFVIGGRTYSLICAVNRAPVADAGPNRSIVSSDQPSTILLGTGMDEDGGVLHFRWTMGAAVLLDWTTVGPTSEAFLPLAGTPAFGTGTFTLTLSVDDGAIISTDEMQLTIDDAPPIVACTGGGTFQAGVGNVVLGGTIADFDGDTVIWSWILGPDVVASDTLLTPAGGTAVAIPSVILSTGFGTMLPLGTHDLVLLVEDGFNAAVACSVQVSVIDTMAATLAPAVDTSILWPPNHQLVPVTIHANAADASGGPVTLTATVQSSENPTKTGSGSTLPDYTEPVIDAETGIITLFLRAERSGRGSGRIYTITILATDSSGSTSSATVTCIAPHDRNG